MISRKLAEAPAKAGESETVQHGPGPNLKVFVYKNVLNFLRGGSSRKLCGSFAEAMAKGGRRPVVATLY